jgi:hypothetical protein
LTLSFLPIVKILKILVMTFALLVLIFIAMLCIPNPYHFGHDPIPLIYVLNSTNTLNLPPPYFLNYL